MRDTLLLHFVAHNAHCAALICAPTVRVAPRGTDNVGAFSSPTPPLVPPAERRAAGGANLAGSGLGWREQGTPRACKLTAHSGGPPQARQAQLGRGFSPIPLGRTPWQLGWAVG